MATSRFTSSVFRRVLKSSLFGNRQQKYVYSTGVVMKRVYSSTAAGKANYSSVDSLIASLAQENSPKRNSTRNLTANNIDSFRKICSQLNASVDIDTSVAILSRFAELAAEDDDVRKEDCLKKELLTLLNESLKSKQPSVISTLEAICAMITLDLSQEPVFQTLIDVLRRHFSTDLFSVPVSPIIRLAFLVNDRRIRLPDDLFQQMREWLQLKASEITERKDIVSVMICWKKNDSWFNMFVEKAKGNISSMSVGELVDMITSLANNSSRPPHVLRLISSTLEQKEQSLSPSQLISLAQSAAKLQFMDRRLRRFIADEAFRNIGAFTKWSQVNAVIDSIARLHVGDSRTWNAVTAWINHNHMLKASISELSYAVYWCAVAGRGNSIQEAASSLCKKLTSTTALSSKAWLSSLYGLAICDRLSAELAQTVLQPSFVSNVLNGLSGFPKLMTLTTIAQLQFLLKAILNKAYQGPFISIVDLMGLSNEITNDMALKLRYGKSEEGNIQYFHSLLHKLIPVNSHAFPPGLCKDGVFINAIVKMDVRANRFVPLSHFEETKLPRLAVIYLSWKDSTLTSSDDEKSTLMGPVLLNLRLLKAMGLTPVLFSQDDFDLTKSLKQQFMLIKTRLEEASNGTENRY